MTEEKKTIRLMNQDKQVTVVPIKKSTEPWSEYELEDGSMVKFKVVAGSVWRLDNEYNPDGSPIYLVQGSPVVYVSYSPDHLRKKTD